MSNVRRNIKPVKINLPSDMEIGVYEVEIDEDDQVLEIEIVEEEIKEETKNSEDMREIKITDSGTIMFPNNVEMRLDKFYDFLEKGIKNYEITNCSYDAFKNKLNFLYNGNKYMIKIENTNSGMGVILLNLVNLEENLRKEKEYQEVIKDRRERLLNDARCGNIYSEEAKQLYIEELKKEISFKGIVKKLREIKREVTIDDELLPDHMLVYMMSMLVLLLILGFIFGIVFNGLIWSLISAVLLVLQILEMRNYGYGIILSNLCMIYGFFRDDCLEEFKMIKDKIKHLERCKFPENEDILKRVEREQFDSKIKERVFQIYQKLNSLNKMDRELMIYKLVKKIEENKKQNKVDNEEEFIKYLEDFEKDIDKLLGVNKEEDKKYAFKGESRGEVLTSDGTKKRVLE